MRLRSLLFVPGDSERKFKGAASGADALILDLEDSVAPAQKAAARRLVAKLLDDRAERRVGFLRPRQCARYGPRPRRSRGRGEAGPRRGHDPEGQWRGRSRPLRPLSRRLRDEGGPAARERQDGGRRDRDGGGDVRPRLVRARASAPHRADLGRRGSFRRARGDRKPGARRRLDLSLSGRAGAMPVRGFRRRCPAIDTIHADFRDLDGLERDCRRSRRDGFLGRMAIHPDQVAIINRCYAPSDDEIAEARRIVEAFTANPNAGTVGIDGRMVDIPHLKAARRTLASV